MTEPEGTMTDLAGSTRRTNELLVDIEVRQFTELVRDTVIHNHAVIGHVFRDGRKWRASSSDYKTSTHNTRKAAVRWLVATRMGM